MSKSHELVFLLLSLKSSVAATLWTCSFLICYSASPRSTHPKLITTFCHIRPEGYRKPRNEVGSLSPTERLVGFKPEILRFTQDSLGHSPKQFWNVSRQSYYLLILRVNFINLERHKNHQLIDALVPAYWFHRWKILSRLEIKN